MHSLGIVRLLSCQSLGRLLRGAIALTAALATSARAQDARTDAGQHGGAVASLRSTLHLRSWLGVGVSGALTVGHFRPALALNILLEVGHSTR